MKYLTNGLTFVGLLRLGLILMILWNFFVVWFSYKSVVDERSRTNLMLWIGRTIASCMIRVRHIPSAILNTKLPFVAILDGPNSRSNWTRCDSYQLHGNNAVLAFNLSGLKRAMPPPWRKGFMADRRGQIRPRVGLAALLARRLHSTQRGQQRVGEVSGMNASARRA